MFIKSRAFKRVQPGLELGFRTFLLLQLLIRRGRLARLSGDLPAGRRCTHASLNCDEACCNTIHKTHDKLRRMHRHATCQDQPAGSESGCCRNEAEAIGLALHFKLAVDNTATK
jgi:hypothetical protein